MGEDEAAEAMAMPSLMSVTIENCKLSCLPSGLSCSKRLALRDLNLYELNNLISLENVPSVVELEVSDCPMLKMINGLSRLQKISIVRCRNIEVLDGVPSLDSMEMEDGTMDTIPEYVAAVTPRYLKFICSKKVYESLSTGSSSEYDKINHIKSRTIDYIAEDVD